VTRTASGRSEKEPDLATLPKATRKERGNPDAVQHSVLQKQESEIVSPALRGELVRQDDSDVGASKADEMRKVDGR
jgi:hypothetical protein